ATHLHDAIQRRPPTLPHPRLPPRRGDLPQLRVEGPRRAAGPDAAARRARDRALPPARRAGGQLAARSARPRLRPCDRRDLARAIRAGGAPAARRARPPAVAPAPRGAALALSAARRSRRRVERGCALASRARGGEEIQAPRPGRARLATATGAIVVAAALALSPFLRGSAHAVELAALVVAAAGAPIQGGVGLELVGVIAASGALTLIAVVSRRALRS